MTDFNHLMRITREQHKRVLEAETGFEQMTAALGDRCAFSVRCDAGETGREVTTVHIKLALECGGMDLNANNFDAIDVANDHGGREVFYMTTRYLRAREILAFVEHVFAVAEGEPVTLCDDAFAQYVN